MGKASFRGHEFHYSDVTLDRDTRFAYRLSRGVGIRDNLDGAVVHNTLGSYTHLHPVASTGYVPAFCRDVPEGALTPRFFSPGAGKWRIDIDETGSISLSGRCR